MPSLPTHSVRVAPEHKDILTAVGALLKRDPGQAEALRALLAGWPNADAAPPLGPFISEHRALTFFRDRLVACLRPTSVWLFGSRARRQHRPDSDFDFLVVLPDDQGRLAHDARRLNEPVFASGITCDVVGCTDGEFEAGRTVPGSIACTVAREGTLLYQRRW